MTEHEKAVTEEEDMVTCCCGHNEEDHKSKSGSCRFNNPKDECFCAGYEPEES